jgi:putative hydrolase of the HAD superfamily
MKSEGRNPKAERRLKSETRRTGRRALNERENAISQGGLASLSSAELASDSGIQAVTFDVGGTLIQCWPSVGHIYAEEAARHGFVDLSPELLNQRFASAWRGLTDFRHARSEWAALVDTTFEGLTPKSPSETFFSSLFERFAEAEAWRIYDDVLPTLETLIARRLKLGIVSNWDDRLRPLLHKMKLDKYFDTIVVSCEVDAPKPDKVIFLEAASGLQVRPEAILHIGDNLESDVHGAIGAGFQALQICREDSEPGDGRIRSLFELRVERLL